MAKQRKADVATGCPCGSGTAYEDCCERYLSRGLACETAEALMRSRYTAFVQCDEPYLLATWHPATRPSRVRFDEDQRWLGLKVRATAAGREGDATGTVEFVARFKVNGRGSRLHEISRFELLDGNWYYRDGEHL